VICGDDVAQGRPAPYLIFHAMEVTGVISVSRVANIGDTRLDLQAGRNAGVRWNIAVLSGAHRQEQLAQAQPTHLLTSVAAVPTLWD
jgi:phosphoglycolate phosphatase-like HAD superfamily hydrolase